jgi:hypothetical protein
VSAKAEEFYENRSLTALRAKARALYAEQHPDSVKELLFENLMEQAYHTGTLDAAMSAMERLLEKKP